MEKLALQGVIGYMRGLFSASWWQRVWTKDWVLKFISLLLAVILWYAVGGEEKVDKNVMVPIEIINLPRELVISNQFKKEIEVTVSGPRSLIQELIDKKVTRQINLAEAVPGTKIIENTNDSVSVPRGISVHRIQPSSIILSLDKLIQKQFPVIPVTTGDAASGYVLKNLRMDPDAITITGPKTILSGVDELLTQIININGMDESRQLQVPLDLDPTIVELIGETSVTADILIQPQVEMKKLLDIPVKASIGGKEYATEPSTVEVIVNVPVILLRQKVDPKTMFSVVALKNGSSEELSLDVIPDKGLKLPIEVLSITPAKVRVLPREKIDGVQEEQAEKDQDVIQEIKDLVAETVELSESKELEIEIKEVDAPEPVEQKTERKILKPRKTKIKAQE